MNFLFCLLLDVGASLGLFSLRAERNRVAADLDEGNASMEAFLSTCRRRDAELFGAAFPGYTEAMTQTRTRRGLR